MIKQCKSVVAGIALLAVFGLTSSAHAAEKSVTDQVREISKEISKAGEEFGRSCAIALREWSEENRVKVRVRYVDCMLIFHKYTYPEISLKFDDSAEGKALKRAYSEYMSAQLENMRTYGLEYIRIVEDESLDADATLQKLKDFVQKEVDDEAPFVAALNKALTDYENR